MRRVLMIFLLIFWVAGCAKKEVPPIVEPKEVPKVAPQVPSKEEKGALEERELAKVLEEKKELTPGKEEKKDYQYLSLYGRSTPPLYAIFFDFDDFSIRSDMWDRIKANAKYLLENPELKIELQGNCDERGTNEYNMALGMKRALEVKKVLIKLGIEENRISVISFGEEKPVCTEHEESCWALNRRVDFVIK